MYLDYLKLIETKDVKYKKKVLRLDNNATNFSRLSNSTTGVPGAQRSIFVF
jgi:hypothetical protein